MPEGGSWFRRVGRFLRPDIGGLSVGATTLGLNLTTTIFQFYYVKVFTSRYLISPNWLTTAQTFYLVCNIITEPTLGFFQDFGCTRFCKNRRRIIMVAGPISAVVFLIPWFAPYKYSADTPWLPGIHLMVVLMLWNVLFVLVGSSWSGLFTEMSTDHAYRVRLYKYSLIATMIAQMSLFPVDKISDSSRNFANFHYCALAVAAVSGCCFIFTAVFGSDAVAQANEVPEGHTGPELSIREQVVGVLKDICLNRDFICAVTSNFFAWCRRVQFANFLSTYTETLLGTTMPPGSYYIASFYFCCNVLPPLVMACLSPVVSYLGTYHTLLLGFVLTWVNSAFGLLLGTFVGYNFLIASLFLEGILSQFGGYYGILLSEVIDDDAKRHNRQSPPTVFIYTLNGMFVRSAVALMPILVVQLLDVVGYDQYKAHLEHSPAYLQFYTFLIAMGLPAALSIGQFVTVLPFRLRSKHAEHGDATSDGQDELLIPEDEDITQAANLA